MLLLIGIIFATLAAALILKVVIAGAFYPNYFACYANNDPVVQRRIFNEMNGRNPNNTVIRQLLND